MGSFDLINFAAVALPVGGLAAVFWEILAKNPHSVLEMMADSRRFAEAPLAGSASPAVRRSDGAPVSAANSNHPRLAA